MRVCCRRLETAHVNRSFCSEARSTAFAALLFCRQKSRRAVVFAGVYTIYMNWRLQFDGFCVKMYLWKKRLFHHGVLWLCILARLIFLQKFRKSRRQRQASCGCEKIRQKFAPAGKPGILYTRAEEEKFPQYIRRIRRRNSFLCF